jgi:formylglycine-generating enzyme required for sulfatase activity
MAPTPRTRRVLLAVAALGVGAVALAWWWLGPHRLEERWCSPLGTWDCMVLIDGGSFLMGAQATDAAAPGYDPDAEPDEAPPHRVELSPYYLALAPVSADAFGECVRAGACRAEDVEEGGGYFNYGAPDRGGHPVNGVTWRGADDFCRFIGARLPTEAEWEFAARGPQGQRFPWGDEPPDCEDRHRAVPHEGCPSDGTRVAGLVLTFAPGGTGEMAGTVWQWVADWYAEDAYAHSEARDPRGPAEGTRRVQRGGSWQTEGFTELRGAYRASLEPDTTFADVGFRCARTPTDADRRGPF